VLVVRIPLSTPCRFHSFISSHTTLFLPAFLPSLHRSRQAKEYQARKNITPVDGDVIAVSDVEGHTGEVDPMHYILPNGTSVPATEMSEQDWYLPRWQTAPFIHKAFVNENIRYNPKGNYTTKTPRSKLLSHVVATGKAIVSEFYTAPYGYSNSTNPDSAFLATLRGFQAGLETPYHGDPMTDLYIPIFDTVDEASRKVVGIMSSLVHWKSFFRNVLPDSIHGINAVLEYNCKGDWQANEHFAANDANKDGHRRLREQETGSGSNTRRREQTISIPNINYQDYANIRDSIMLDAETPTSSKLDAETPITETPTTTMPTSAAIAAPTAATNVPTPAPTEATVSATGNPTVTLQYEVPTVSVDSSTANPTGTTTTTESATSESKYSYVTTEPQEIKGDPKAFTVVIAGVEAYAVGHGDLHEREFSQYRRDGFYVKQFKMKDGTFMGVPIDESCAYELHVYPSKQFYDQYVNNDPWIITMVIAFVFLFAIAVFWVYNIMVEARQKKILRKATQTTALVSTLFPKNVRDRLLQDEQNGGAKGADKYGFGTKSRLKGFVAGETNDEVNDTSAAPIADLFPHCTVFFGDIAGFTAWSSTREPSQVFTLLQNLYQAFDSIAKKRGVFKVETIGDCYMYVIR